MTSKLKIPDEEFGRFLLAYHRGVFPRTFRLGAAFLFYHGLFGWEHIRRETNDEKAIEVIREEFCGRLS